MGYQISLGVSVRWPGWFKGVGVGRVVDVRGCMAALMAGNLD